MSKTFFFLNWLYDEVVSWRGRDRVNCSVNFCSVQSMPSRSCNLCGMCKGCFFLLYAVQAVLVKHNSVYAHWKFYIALFHEQWKLSAISLYFCFNLCRLAICEYAFIWILSVAFVFLQGFERFIGTCQGKYIEFLFQSALWVFITIDGCVPNSLSI